MPAKSLSLPRAPYGMPPPKRPGCKHGEVSWDTSSRRRRIRAGVSPVSRGMREDEDLPPGYRLQQDPDILLLLGPDGSVVAAFSALGADPLEVFAAAWEDHGGRRGRGPGLCLLLRTPSERSSENEPSTQPGE